MGIHLLSAKQYTADSSEPPASLSPTVQNSLVKRPSQALQDLLQASPADQLLPSFPQKPPSPEKADDSSSDEERLIEEILDVSAKTSLTESSRMVRQAASKPFLGQDVVARMASLPQYLVEGLKHLSLFPESFSAEAAVSVMGMNHLSIVTLPANILRPLIESNLVRPLPSGRFAMNDITKTLINSESTADGRGAHNRFISYFVDKLRHLDANSLSADGEDRLKAMKVYDAERANMQAALRMCRDIGGLKLVMSFLTQAATVMRYSTSPHERTEIFGQALNDMEMAVDTQSLDVEAEARIRLALGEAYFDSLSFEKAKDHLQKVIGVMVGVTDGSTVSVSSSVLALLLLAELRISNHEFLDAKKWLFQAVRTLQGANMQKSTFAVCCFLSLASVCTSMNQTSEALHTVNAAIDVLAEMGFTDMPIYADALRTLGTVHFRTGDWKKAQDAFFAALNICQKWMSRSDWDSAPFQHCTHLDIFLVESIAQTYIAQNRHEEAGRLMQTAQQQRLERRLDSKSNQSSSNSLDSEKSARMYTRHLY